jgi:plastocyanin
MAVHRSTYRRVSALCALLLASAALAACGGGSSSDDSSSSSTSASGSGGSGGGATTQPAQRASASAGSALAVSAVERGEDDLGFSQRTLRARAGTVTIRLANGSGDEYPHGIAIEGDGVDKDGSIVQPGGTSAVTVKLKPGRYTFYCPVGEHEEYGMKGTVTVT